MTRLPVLGILVFCIGCQGPTFGGPEHDVSADIEKMAGGRDGLDTPQDLAFNPEVDGELWIVNNKDDSVTILFNAGTADQTSDHIIDPYAVHFMDEVTSIAFGKPDHFATCQDSRNPQGGMQPENEFMGPTLWSSDLDIFGESNPEAVEAMTEMFGFPADLGSHLDMLHESPECMGIAWEKKNVYWVFDGYHDSITRYDFAEDHGAGYDDHSDGIISRYVEGDVKRKNNVVSHLELDAAGLLYIADTGNNRVAILDTNTGREGSSLSSQEPGVDHHKMKNADLWTFIDEGALEIIVDADRWMGEGEDAPSFSPAGIALVEDMLYVTNNALGTIHIFDTLTGEELGWANTGLGSGTLQGIIAVSSTEVWFASSNNNAVYRLNTEPR